MTTQVPPVTFKECFPTGQDARWLELNAEAGGNPYFPPLVIKGAYVFGVIHDICESVELLLQHEEAWPVTYLPAFGICTSGIELLGRCLNGDKKVMGTPNLKDGFEYLFEVSRGKTQIRVLVTKYGQYEIARLIALRHFAAHGQATATELRKGGLIMDIELLNDFPNLIANAMEAYWEALVNSDYCCRKLADANVAPLRSAPIKKMWKFFTQQPNGTFRSAGDSFRNFKWSVSHK